MTLFNSLRLAGLSIIVFALAGIAAAQGPAVATSTTSELTMAATVQTAVQLNISTGTGGATVDGTNASTGLFSVSFGNVNGLGLGTPTSGVSVDVDSTGALYKTPINLTPVYSGFTTEEADVTVDQGNAGDEVLLREGSSAISSSSTVLVSHAAFSGAASGSDNERWVGFYIPRIEAAGAKTGTLIYTVTVQ